MNTRKVSAVAQTASHSSALGVRIGWISIFALLTGLCALVRIQLPFSPVPLTLQTMAVVGGGMILGRDGVWAQLLYLVLGGIGLPLFAGSPAGFPYLFGATGGYLIGFVAAAALAARWIHPFWAELSPARRFLRVFGVSLIVFVPGVLQLSLVTGMSLWQAVLLGFLPFLAGDVLKSVALAALPSRCRR